MLQRQIRTERCRAAVGAMVEGIEADPSLDAAQAEWLGQRLQPHPGHTITDAASMQRPITEQSVTVIADTGDDDPRQSLPDSLAREDRSTWYFRSVPEGHWPMLGALPFLVDHLADAAFNAQGPTVQQRAPDRSRSAEPEQSAGAGAVVDIALVAYLYCNALLVQQRDV